jgi:large subunit ribosomal protein L6
MSRVAKKPVILPNGVECKFDDTTITVKGPKGAVSVNSPAGVSLRIDAGQVLCEAKGETDTKFVGTARALLANMVKGVADGFERKLELVGVGYKASMQGKTLNLTLGFSHPVSFVSPDGITLETPTATEILIKGVDKQRVGQVAAKIRAYRPPEPYKGKGVRYAGEQITLKEAKKA